MRVGIDATCWSNRRGYGRFTRGLLTALGGEASDHEFTLVADRATAEMIPPGIGEIIGVEIGEAPAEAARAGGRRSFSDLWKLSRAVGRARFDAFFFPAVYSWFPVSTPMRIVTIHDVIAEDYPELVFPERKDRFLWNTKVSLAVRQAEAIAAVSDHARLGIARRHGLAAHRIAVISEAPDAAFRVLPDHELDRELFERLSVPISGGYFVYFGGINPHKNLPLLVKVLAGIPNTTLVVVAEIDREIFTPGLAALREAIVDAGMGERVIFTGFLPDGEACQIINRARALVLPSMAEGFGLPAVEAAACGVPVIATRNSPLPELLGGGGIFIDPEDRGALREALLSMLDDDRRRSSAMAALERAALLSWKNSAGAFLQLLDRLSERSA